MIELSVTSAKRKSSSNPISWIKDQISIAFMVNLPSKITLKRNNLSGAHYARVGNSGRVSAFTAQC